MRRRQRKWHVLAAGLLALAGVAGSARTAATAPRADKPQDSAPPVFSNVPASVVLEATSRAGVQLSYPLPTATDLVDGVRPVTCTPPPHSYFPIGKTIVVCSASDAQGNSAEMTFSVTVRDTTPPAFGAAPANIVLRVKDRPTAKARYAPPVATDIVDGEVTAVCTPRSGSAFKLGTTRVVCKATDSHGNSSTTSFRVRVAKLAWALLSPADRARLTAPPLLHWTKVASATYYNVQLYRNGHKIMSVWPHSSVLRLTRDWKYKGVGYRLTAATYQWFVWPGFGALASAHYGNLIGQRTFTIG